MSGTIAGSATMSIFANSATLGGHCEVGDSVFIGGLSAVHQFARIGSQAMIGGVSGVRGDVIPFGLANGQHAFLEGLNVVGMRRRKFTRERLHKLRAFYQELFHGPGAFAERLAALQGERDDDPAIARDPRFPRLRRQAVAGASKAVWRRPAQEA